MDVVQLPMNIIDRKFENKNFQSYKFSEQGYDENLIKDLEQVQRDRKGGIDKSNLQLTHSLDAASYLIEYKYPIIKRVATSMKW